MSSFTYLLLEGEKVEMEVHPDEINTVAVSFDNGSVIYAVAGASEERKLLELQMILDIAASEVVEDSNLISLPRFEDECLAA